MKRADWKRAGAKARRKSSSHKRRMQWQSRDGTSNSDSIKFRSMSTSSPRSYSSWEYVNSTWTCTRNKAPRQEKYHEFWGMRICVTRGTDERPLNTHSLAHAQTRSLAHMLTHMNKQTNKRTNRHTWEGGKGQA